MRLCVSVHCFLTMVKASRSGPVAQAFGVFVTCAKSKSPCHDSCDRDAFVMAMVSLCSSHHCLCVPCVDACLEGVVVVAMRCGNQCHDIAMLLPCQRVVTMCSFTIICSRHALARCCHAFPMVTLPRLAYCPGAPTSSKSSTSKFAASEGPTRGANMWRPLSARFSVPHRLGSGRWLCITRAAGAGTT